MQSGNSRIAELETLNMKTWKVDMDKLYKCDVKKYSIFYLTEELIYINFYKNLLSYDSGDY